ncbi:MAG: large conductance mechanosensitive channel protein MscL [Alphaproteobacteria bacterium]|nr:large conductance mechanosensitive channel protein MscL [Alphaproteobacteria bacterium]
MFKNFIREFKEFAEKGNALDMAVGVIAGATMTSVVNSLVRDIMMPPIGVIIGGIDFSQFFIVLKDSAGILEHHHYASLTAAQAAGAVTLNVGLFANAIVSFLITMFAIFMVVRVINRIRHKAPPAPTRVCPYCFVDKVDRRATICPSCASKLTPLTTNN